MKNILIIDNSKYVTGALKSIVLFARTLSGKYKFHWAVTNDISDDEIKKTIGEQFFRRFNFIEISKKISILITYFPQLLINTWKLRKLIKQNNIEIVHVNDCFNMCGVMLKIFDRRIKLVYHVRLLPTSYISKLYGTFIRIISRFADLIVCCSYAVSDSIGEVPQKTVVYDSSTFSENDIIERKISSELKTIIYVGNILPGKGHALALEAFALLMADNPEMELRFLGKYDHSEVSREFKKKLDFIITSHKMAERVKFDGFKFEIEKEIKKADLLLNLSESESFSMVCLESLKCGTPLVASDCGGPAELFEHLKSGWLVPNLDYIAASEAIGMLAQDVKLREKFSKEGFKYVKSKFDIAENAKKLADLYSKLFN